MGSEFMGSMNVAPRINGGTVTLFAWIMRGATDVWRNGRVVSSMVRFRLRFRTYLMVGKEWHVLIILVFDMFYFLGVWGISRV